MEALTIVTYYLSVIGLTLAFAKLYVGKKIREFISHIRDEQFYNEAGTSYENEDLYLRVPSDGWTVFLCESDKFEQEGRWSLWQSYVGRLVRCPACSGFWIGLGIAAFRFLDIYSIDSYVWCVTYALGASALSLLFWGIMVKLGIMEWG